MPRTIICAKCDCRKRPCRKDPDFCQTCFNEIEEMTNNPMKHAQAAVGLIRTTNFGRDPAFQMYAFLSIFHPKMSDRRKRELAESTRER